MDDTMHAAMAEATRLTRAGRLTGATAIIQRTLRGGWAPEAASSAAAGGVDEPIDATFSVVDEPAAPAGASAPGPAGRGRVIALPPPPDVEPSPPRAGRGACAEPTEPGSDSDKAQRSGGPWTATHTPWSRQAAPNPLASELTELLGRTLRAPRSGLRAPGAVRRPDRDRKETETGGQFVSASFTNRAGTRPYKLYVPSGYRGQRLPLIVMLHGCTQGPDDFAAGTRMNALAERELFLVLYPEQTLPANQSRCWNWFKASDQHRGRGEPSIIAGMTREIMSYYHIDARRVDVAGLSAGGAMAMVMGVSYPDLFAAIGVHSGLPYGAAHDLPSAFAAMQNPQTSARPSQEGGFPTSKTHLQAVPTIVFHGDRDTTVHPGNGDRVLAQWATVHAGAGTGRAAGTKLRMTTHRGQVHEGLAYTRSLYRGASGEVVLERWLVHGAGHGWSGGSPAGSFTEPRGPDASQAMVRFFHTHPAGEPYRGRP